MSAYLFSLKYVILAAYRLQSTRVPILQPLLQLKFMNLSLFIKCDILLSVNEIDIALCFPVPDPRILPNPPHVRGTSIVIPDPTLSTNSLFRAIINISISRL
jgi:hypothetical protein